MKVLGYVFAGLGVLAFAVDLWGISHFSPIGMAAPVGGRIDEATLRRIQNEDRIRMRRFGQWVMPGLIVPFVLYFSGCYLLEHSQGRDTEF